MSTLFKWFLTPLQGYLYADKPSERYSLFVRNLNQTFPYPCNSIDSPAPIGHESHTSPVLEESLTTGQPELVIANVQESNNKKPVRNRFRFSSKQLNAVHQTEIA